MPRRLAPLLIFLHIVLTYATEPTPEPTHPPVKDVAVPLPDVFIPLKEWKRQRLQDIESRVRKAEEKRTSPRRRHSAVCRPRTRLLAFLSRLDVCPPSAPPLTTAPNAPSDDPYWVSGQHAYGDVNRSAVEETAPSQEDPQPPLAPAVSPPVEEHADDTRPQELITASAKPAVEAPQDDQQQVPIERDELTGRIDKFIPKVLPRVLPNVIPKVGEIVKSIKEASLAYTASGDTRAESVNLSGKAPGGNSTGNSTSQNANENKLGNRERATSDNEVRREPPKPEKDQRESVFEDEQLLNVIVKHSNSSGVEEKPFNYASIDAGARVLAFSNGVVGAKNVIQGSNDKYLLSPCAGSGIAGSRFVDLELSEEVILESIETGNFEYYSSSPRKIAALGASKYPPKKWNVLGIFDFANVKTLQKFQIEKRGVTRYLRVIFAGKQGTEYYCPISTVRAFGKNLLADLKEVLEKPTPPRRPASEGSAGSKSKTERESDKSKNDNTRNTKKVETKASEKAEKCPGDDCKEPKEISTLSGSPAARPKDTSEEDTHEARRQGDVDTQSDENEDTEAGTGAQDEKDGGENRNGAGDDGFESNLNPDEKNNNDEENASDDAVRGEDNRDANQANYGDGDHVSEDDQVVIDALRSDTLSPVDGDDNIFRKVTRMLRLLELNQTLTNQYIDTQLAKFAIALSDAHSTSRNASERLEIMQRQFELLIVRLETQIEDLTRASFRRDILLCALLICVAFLVGTHWILWSAVSGARLHEEGNLRKSLLDSDAETIDRMLQTDAISRTAITRVDGSSSEGPSPAGRKKKRKARRPFAGENMNGGYFSGSKLPPANGLGARIDGRSISSYEISVNERRGSRGTGGTFDVLGRMADQ